MCFCTWVFLPYTAWVSRFDSSCHSCPSYLQISRDLIQCLSMMSNQASLWLGQAGRAAKEHQLTSAKDLGASNGAAHESGDAAGCGPAGRSLRWRRRRISRRSQDADRDIFPGCALPVARSHMTFMRPPHASSLFNTHHWRAGHSYIILCMRSPEITLQCAR